MRPDDGARTGPKSSVMRVPVWIVVDAPPPLVGEKTFDKERDGREEGGGRGGGQREREEEGRRDGVHTRVSMQQKEAQDANAGEVYSSGDDEEVVVAAAASPIAPGRRQPSLHAC